MVVALRLPILYAAAHIDHDTHKIDVFISGSLNACVDKSLTDWPDAQIYVYRAELMTGDKPDDSSNRIDEPATEH